MSAYEQDREEYREEDKRTRHEQRYIPWIDPRDPNYIGPEDEEA
jgi:hypothetical protein